MNADEARRLVGAGLDDPTDVVKRKARAFIASQHPDHGGTRERLEVAMRAREVLGAWLEERRICPECNGAREVEKRIGFSSLRIACNACGGTGQRCI